VDRLDAGGNFVDTADVLNGVSEEIIGRALREKRRSGTR
jgi:aryl-alcohol dehydrogenase-like predicted oxidoreductase